MRLSLTTMQAQISKKLMDLIPIVTDHHKVVLISLFQHQDFREPLWQLSLCGVEGAKHGVRTVRGN